MIQVLKINTDHGENVGRTRGMELKEKKARTSIQYLKPVIYSVMYNHHKRAGTHHIIDPGKEQQHNGNEMVQELRMEILPTYLQRKWVKVQVLWGAERMVWELWYMYTWGFSELQGLGFLKHGLGLMKQDLSFVQELLKDILLTYLLR